MLTTKHTLKMIQPVALEVSRFKKAENTNKVEARVNTVVPTKQREYLKKPLPKIPKTRPPNIRRIPTRIC